MKKARRRGKRGVIFGLIFVCFVIFVVFQCSRKYGVETEFDSVEEFTEYGGIILVDIPEGAANVKFYCNNMSVIGLESAYSFELNSEEEYDAFMEANGYKIRNDKTVAEYMVNPPKYTDEFEIRDWYGYVVDDDIKDYNVLDYDSFDASYHAVLVDEESRRVVVIKYATL